MEEDIKRVILTITATAVFLICWFTSPALSQRIVCGPSDVLVGSIERRFAERESERGIESNTDMLVILTVNIKGQWSLLISPKSDPTALCVPVTGNKWEQKYNKSSGVAFDGSILTVNFDDDGKWRMYYFESQTGNLQKLMEGYNWERLWEFDKSL